MVGMCHQPNLRKPADSSYSRTRRFTRRSEVRAGFHASVGGGDAARAVLEGPTRVGERLTTPSELQETSLRKLCSKARLCSRFRDDVGRYFPPGTPTSGSHLSDAPNTRRHYREANHRARLAPATVSSKTAAFANPSA